MRVVLYSGQEADKERKGQVCIIFCWRSVGVYWTMLRFVDSNIELQVLYIVMYRYTVNHRVFKKKKIIKSLAVVNAEIHFAQKGVRDNYGDASTMCYKRTFWV